MAKATVHMVGGNVVELELDGTGPREAVQRLMRERALVGRLCTDDAGDLIGCEVIVPANRVHMVRWS